MSDVLGSDSQMGVRKGAPRVHDIFSYWNFNAKVLYL